VSNNVTSLNVNEKKMFKVMTVYECVEISVLGRRNLKSAD